MHEGIGNAAGAISRVLETECELSLAQFKKAVKGKAPNLRLGSWMACA